MNAPLDLAGIGAGPFNLAVAALIHNQPLRSAFFESKQRFEWHPGLMLPGAELQTSFLKDLVTPVDPTNRFSFLAYLVTKGRFYDFMNAEQSAVTRREFSDYLAWAAEGLPNVHMSSPVTRVDAEDDCFVLRVGQRDVRARHLCVAAGKRPHIPDCCRPHLSDQCFHALQIGQRPVDLSGRRVAVIGGGQTGAEVVLNVLNAHWGQPARLGWFTRRSNFLPLDETPFTNEWFTPEYVAAFRQLPAHRRDAVVTEQKLASDGISPGTLKALYQALYRSTHLETGKPRVTLHPYRSLTRMDRSGALMLQLHNGLDERIEHWPADVVILCTGLEEALPECLAPLRPHLARDAAGRPELADAFRATLHGLGPQRLYLLNMGRHSHGIAEPQLSLSAWRAGCVVNDVMGKPVYATRSQGSVLRWSSEIGATGSSAAVA
ncbi:SidA/IucD/PvdA family monooxygenase [uncultured Abyssibacter sp.]|uniref:lysine N(6)-hydroxylase/L-ornithine N(5)-oxygenase family protein n=1 Tax=uncultured Abyssibacter sp. TaxID=2320202 RepID=UPI0032B1071B